MYTHKLVCWDSYVIIVLLLHCYLLSTQLIFKWWTVRLLKPRLIPLKSDSTVTCPSTSTLTRTSCGYTTDNFLHQAQTDTPSPTGIHTELGSLVGGRQEPAESQLWSSHSHRYLTLVATLVPSVAPMSHRISNCQSQVNS